MQRLREADPALHALAVHLGPGAGPDRQLAALKQLAARKRDGEPAAPLVRALVARALAGPPAEADVFSVRAALLALQEIAPHEAETFQSFVEAAGWKGDGSAVCKNVQETALRLLAVQASQRPGLRFPVAAAAAPLLSDRSLCVSRRGRPGRVRRRARPCLPELRRLLLTASGYVRREVEKAIAAIEAAEGAKG